MKRIFTAFFLLLLIAAVCGGALTVQARATDRLLNACDDIREAWERGDRAACAQQAAALLDCFDRETRLFPFFLHHDDVEALHTQIAALPHLLTGDEQDAFPAELTRITAGLKLLMEAEQLRLENIL